VFSSSIGRPVGGQGRRPTFSAQAGGNQGVPYGPLGDRRLTQCWSSLPRASALIGEHEAVDSRRLKVWSWFGNDPKSVSNLQFVIAVASRAELQKVSVRLSLPSPKRAVLLKPSATAYAEAMAHPDRLLWWNMDDVPLSGSAPPVEWSSEEQLADLRAATLRPRPGGSTD